MPYNIKIISIVVLNSNGVNFNCENIFLARKLLIVLNSNGVNFNKYQIEQLSIDESFKLQRSKF